MDKLKRVLSGNDGYEEESSIMSNVGNSIFIFIPLILVSL